MELTESRSCVGGDAGLREWHCLVCGQMPPRIGTEMVPAKDKKLRRASFGLSQIMHQSRKIGWSQSGIATQLVHLIAGGLNQCGLAGFDREP